ncbi:MAG TPA: entericidin A/B family lipoprotein [Burkholderiaceae bacterium]|nr:entericidin A/B family lipoprotein [Burkholderiaceae bacterium]
MKNLLVLVVAMVVLNACNTVQGMGKDVQRAGTAVEKAAK